MYETIGLLFVKAYKEKLPVGGVFSLRFFQDLQAFSEDALSTYKENPKEWVRGQCEKEYAERIQPVREAMSLDDLRASELVTVYSYDIEEEEIRQELTERGVEVTDTHILEECKRKVIDEYLDDQAPAMSELYQAVFLVAEAMHSQMGAGAWRALCKLKGEDLQVGIQGAFTKKLFVDSITWSGKEDAKTKEYLLNWIEKHTDEEVQELLQFTTGSLSLVAGKKIDVKLFEPDGDKKLLPSAHTCSNEIDIYTVYTNQDEFDQALNLSISSMKEGFGFA